MLQYFEDMANSTDENHDFDQTNIWIAKDSNDVKNKEIYNKLINELDKVFKERVTNTVD